MKSADHLIDIGPGAGIHGGQIIAQGTPQDVMNEDKSLTGQYLTGKQKIKIPQTRRKKDPSKTLTIKGAQANNLKNVNAQFPLGTFICVTGVSGGGKSSLVIETLYKALARQLHNSRLVPGKFDSLEGAEFIDKIVDIFS